MKFSPTCIADALLVDLDPISDDRGFFSRVYCQKEFVAQGIENKFVQANLTYTRKKGTMRGLHYQSAPNDEAKLVRCISGSLFDVVVDVRKESQTYLKWFGAELSATNKKMMYVPAGCAHGTLSLEDDTESLYWVSAVYTPGAERGICFDDPLFNIEWPIDVRIVSEKDREWRSFC